MGYIIYGFLFQLSFISVLLLEIPVLLLALFAYMLNHKKSILFYLIAIDGMIVLKAFFGILSALLMNKS